MQYGPERSPSAGGVEDLQSTLARFRKMLSGFCQAPWTLQRFCELLLEPRKQYRVLRKVRTHAHGGCDLSRVATCVSARLHNTRVLAN